MTTERDCQQNTNDVLCIVQPSSPRKEVLQAAAVWMAKLATATLETPFVKPARVKKVDAYRATPEGKAAKAENGRVKYAAKVLAEEGRPVRPINVPAGDDKTERRREQWRSSKRARRAAAAKL